MTIDLKKIGISFNEPDLVEKYYGELRGILVKSIAIPNQAGLFLNLDALPVQPINFKEVFIKWLVFVNLSRIKYGDEPITDLNLILKCPIWKVITPPLKRIDLTKEGMFNKPGFKTIGKQAKPGSINKK